MVVPLVTQHWSMLRRNLGRVDGFDEDEAECEGDEGEGVPGGLLAAQRSATRLKRLSLPTVCSMRARPL